VQTKTALHQTCLVALDPAKIPIPSKVVLLCGPAAALHPLVLQSLLLRAFRQEQLGVIVGDNRFDAYLFARFAKARGFDPSALLAQIRFSRPFTCHQLHHCILNLVEKEVSHWRALYVLGLLETFWDEDIRYRDVTRLLNEILVRLRHIASQGLSVLVTVSLPPKETTRSEFVMRVMRASDAYWEPLRDPVEPFTARQTTLW
jgi:hypothetical protein